MSLCVCATKVVHELIDCPTLEGVNVKRYAMVKDRLFVLYKRSFEHVFSRGQEVHSVGVPMSEQHLRPKQTTHH
jgi:hypothetical protein